jgi:hypothetical protein
MRFNLFLELSPFILVQIQPQLGSCHIKTIPLHLMLKVSDYISHVSLKQVNKRQLISIFSPH